MGLEVDPLDPHAPHIDDGPLDDERAGLTRGPWDGEMGKSFEQ